MITRRLVAIARGLAVAAFALFAVFPIAWVLKLALVRATFFGAEGAFTLDNFARFVFARDYAGRLSFFRQLANSLWIGAASAGIGVALSLTAAFALSRFSFPLRREGMRAMLLSQMFPAVVTSIPLLFLLDAIGLFGHRLGLVIVYATTTVPFSVWMLKGYFDAVPRELEEAARLDGASSLFLFRKIMLPLVAPGIGITFVFSFMNAYNEFILASLFLDDVADYTLPVTLYETVGGFDPDWGTFAAGSVVLSLPMILLFYFVQRKLSTGLLAGAVKG